MMATLTVKTASGASAGSVEVSDKVFAIEPNKAVLHQVVTAQLAARRAGSQSTLTRGEVRGGGIKPWRQKGTGRARQGSIRAPHWEGGGVTHAPKPRSYAQRTPKKMVRLALASALSDRASSDRIVVVDSWDFSQPKTKDAMKALTALGVEGRILLVLTLEDEIAWKSFRNVPSVHVLSAGELNAYDILVSDYVIFTKNSVPVGDLTVSRGHKGVAGPSDPSERDAKSPSGSSGREEEADS
jgi:large subunit ribosomal protein L4